MALPKLSKERLKLIEDIRKQGDFIHNTCSDQNTGILIVSRRQQQKTNRKADDYICCPKCKGFYTKFASRQHSRKCVQKHNSRSNFIEGRKLTQYIHHVASPAMKTTIFPVLRNDNITKAIRFDELIIRYGNRLSEKLSQSHHHDQIRANMRLLGRFKIEFMKIVPEISELKDIFKPYLFDNAIEALRKTAKWTFDKGFATPAVATSLSSLIKKCARIQRNEFIKCQNEDSKCNLDNFISLWVEETPVQINKKALEDLENRKRTKTNDLPSKNDIKILYDYLRTIMLDSFAELCLNYNFISWKKLLESTLIFIQVFNRRRAGEIERLTIENFNKKEQITDCVEAGMLENISKQSINFAKQFVRITLRGKLGRTVSVLLDPLCIKSINIILKFREKAGISKTNPYIFSAPGKSSLAKSYCRACPLLRKFASECGALIPDTLRGTKLRKHIATYTSLLNVQESTVDRLANFLGHHKDIHKSIYRVPVPVAEITSVSKILLSAAGCNLQNSIETSNSNRNIVSDNEGSMQYEGLEENSEDSETDMVKPKRRSTSPFGRTIRKRWSSAEIDSVKGTFGDILALEKLPSIKQCAAAIEKNICLCKRTPAQLKTWIDNQRKKVAVRGN
ncbi:uncharacterized protein LOC131803367 isoform X1 [Musca domestica]|uniref:Uncharacterized protein LOC131803367 isoform X1 n=1 Tax=Musca domestica TaxID=7370 RepID=A0ABM3V456_MUSDO|nr:uncharacterized protein LOC131803367 isoform X1 [Musca domestica]